MIPVSHPYHTEEHTVARLKHTPQGLERRNDGVWVMIVEEDEAIHVDEVSSDALAAIATAIHGKAAPTTAGNRLAVNRFMSDKDVYWLDDPEDRVDLTVDVEPNQDAEQDQADDENTLEAEADVSDETGDEQDEQSEGDTDEQSEQGDGETDDSESDDDTDEGDGEGEAPPLDLKVRSQETGEEGWVPAADFAAALAEMLGQSQQRPQDAPVSPETVPQVHTPKPPKVTVDESQYKDNGRMYHEAEPTVIAAAMGGQHVFLYGPPGTGKSHMATRYAGLTGQRLDIVSCHPHLTVSSLVGYITPEGLKPGPMYLSAQHNGVLCLDEVDNTGPGVHASANSSMANNLLQIQDHRIDIGPDWRVFMTANTMGQGATADFVGRQKLDAATLDRVASFFIGTDEVLEHNLLVAMGLPNDLRKEWHAIIRRMRDNVDHHGLRCFVSMRTTLAGARQLLTQQSPAWRRAGYATLSPMDIARMRVLAKLPAEQAAKVLD